MNCSLKSLERARLPSLKELHKTGVFCTHGIWIRFFSQRNDWRLNAFAHEANHLSVVRGKKLPREASNTDVHDHEVDSAQRDLEQRLRDGGGAGEGKDAGDEEAEGEKRLLAALATHAETGQLEPVAQHFAGEVGDGLCGEREIAGEQLRERFLGVEEGERAGERRGSDETLRERVEEVSEGEEKRVGRRDGLQGLRETCEEALETGLVVAVEERQQGELEEEARQQVVEEAGGFPEAASEGGGGVGGGLEEGSVEIGGL